MTDNPERSAEMHPHPSAEPEPASVLNAAGAGSSIKPPRYKTKRADNWTDERIKQLTRRWADGASCSVIGAEFGVTRNAIIGKLHRLGLSEKKIATKPKSTRIPGYRKVSSLTNLQATFAPPINPNSSVKRHKLIISNPVVLMDLEPYSCRYPIHNDGEPALFCGNWHEPKIPYCAGHCRIAYQPARSR